MRIARARPRLAPGRGAQPAGAHQADGVPRDHPPGDRDRGRAVPRHRRRPGRRPGGPAHRRPPLRLPGLRGAVAQDQLGPVGRAGAVAGRAPGGRARARAHGVRGRRLLGPAGRLPHRPRFSATLVGLDGNRVATGKDFDSQGRVARDGVAVLDEAAARSLVTALDGSTYTVRSVEEKPYRSSPSRRSSPRRSSRRAAASWACPRARSCGRPRASTSAATSPTCGPTR